MDPIRVPSAQEGDMVIVQPRKSGRLSGKRYRVAGNIFDSVGDGCRERLPFLQLFAVNKRVFIGYRISALYKFTRIGLRILYLAIIREISYQTIHYISYINDNMEEGSGFLDLLLNNIIADNFDNIA